MAAYPEIYDCINLKTLDLGYGSLLQEWLKEVYGWANVQTYALTIHKESGKTLSQIREEYMNRP